MSGSTRVSDSENRISSIERRSLDRTCLAVDDQSEFFRQIVESSPVPIHTARPDGYLDFLNQAWLDFAGVQLERLLGWGWTSCIHPDDVEAFVRIMRESFAKGKPFQETSRVRRADGVYRWVLHLEVPVFDGAGNLIKWSGSSIDIDDGKRAAEQLIKSAQDSQRSEFDLAEAQRLGHIGSWVFDPAAGFVHWSRELFQIYGLDPVEGPPNSERYLALVHPEDREFIASLIKRMLVDDIEFDVTKRIVRAGGEVRFVRCVRRVVSDNDPSKRIGVGIDVTDHEVLTQELRRREQAEERIRLSEKELRTLIETIPAFVGTALPDGSCDFLSESWLDYLGFTKEQGLGWGWADSIHPEDFHRVVASWRAGLAAKESVEQELRCRSADGTYHWFLNRDSPLRDNEGNIVKWYGTLVNIDAMKEAEHALQTREHELLGLIETIPSLVWSASPAGEVNYANQRFLEYCGAPLEEFVNSGWESFIHPDDLENTAKAFARAINTGESHSIIHRCRRADGDYRWHHAMSEPLRDPQGKIIRWYGLSVDIDERKRAEDHLRDTRIKLTKASRLATVAEFAASIAHELNQPLMSILANAQAAKKWLNAAQSNVTEVNSSIERVIRDAHAADETMQHIRALFKQKSFEKKNVNIPNILREVVRIVQEDPKKRDLPIECHFEESLRTVHVDQIQIQQVFINLIVNAIEALEGQQVAPLVILRAVTESDGILIQVIDNGPGVDDPDRIFDSFMTTKEKGMGIGLAVSRSIVEAHGGQLWAENNNTGGATFNVTLPLPHTKPTVV